MKPDNTPISFETLLQKMHAYTQQQEGLRNSSKRAHILRVLYDQKTHLSPDEVYREVREKYDPKIGVSTVYRTLALFAEAGLVNQLSLGKDVMCYEIDFGSHHDHLICSECGAIVEFYNAEIEKLQEHIAQKYHYQLKDHEMKLIGVCPVCQASQST
jgi:Fur family transcriptional regulator, ferric uptake regulator